MNGGTIKIHRGPAIIVLLMLTGLLVYMVNFYQDERPILYAKLRSQSKYINMRKLLIAGIQAAQRGGLEVLQVARTRDLKEHSKGKTDEGVNDPVTDADARSHCIMKNGLHRLFPRLRIFSEEDNQVCQGLDSFDLDPTVLHESAQVPDELVKAEDITVWIDPLDATKEFTEQLYQYVTTMVCVAVLGKPIMGIIHSPFSGETAWAWANQASSEYLTTLHAKNPKHPNQIITVSRSHAGDVKDLTRAVFGEQSEILTAAGSGYKVLQVVSGNATAYLHSTKIKKWDICAGDAILRSLNGAMTTLEDMLIDYGPNNSPVNDRGLLATLYNHSEYIDKLITYLNKHKKS